MKLNIKKFIAFIMLVITIFSTFSNMVSATEISSAQIKDGGDCGFHLQFWDSKQNAWSYIQTYFTYYTENGVEYPAYCLDVNLPGVGGEHGEYGVDISSVIDDVRLWRVAINSYPYQTPESLGLENKFDAFVATKQAIYSILYDYDVETHFRGGDSRGVAIKNAMARLVDIGRNGSQTPVNTDLQVNKVDELYEDGQYYSQKYNVNSPVETSIYSITATAGLPEGSRITDLTGNEKSTFGGNEVFKVQIPKDKLSSDINVIINVKGKCKTYPVFYGKSQIPGRQDYLITFDPFGDLSGRATLNVQTNTGVIEINKIDSETKQPIEGVTFQLQKLDGTVIGNATTDKNGQASFSMLYQGKYVLKEISTNDKYILNKNTFDIDVQYNGTTNKTITNEHKKGNLKVYKVDKDNHKIALGNVHFDLYSEEFKKIIGTYTTNVDGEFQVNDLRIGEYKLIEKNTGKWYNLADDKTVEVKWDTTEENIVENELKKGQIKVIKVDKDNNEIKIEGVTFEVLDENNNVLEKIITNKNGEALTSRYPLRDFENLKIREVETLDNYVLSDEVKTITLKENDIVTTTFENEKKKGQIKVIKIDLDNNKIKLPNVEFNVYDEKGNIVDTLITDENGECVSKKLPIDQKYQVQEVKTSKFYVLNDTPQTAILEQDKITDLTFTNEKKKGQVKVIKVDKDNNEILLEGVTFEIKDNQGNVVDTIITNSKGEAISKKLPIDQNYTVIETETKQGYVLTEETQTVTLEQDQIINLTFENEKIKGYLEITKVDSKTKETLQGVKFGIFDTEDKKICELTTDEKGKATSELIPYGKYFIKELDSGSVYYLLNENTFEFEIVDNLVTVPVTIENDSVDIKVTVEKEGTTEIKPGEKVDYTFKDVGNTSNVYLENFKWFDYIPTDYERLEKMTTGTWNQELTYDVYYKTNKTNDYIIFKNGLNTQENYDLDFTTIKLADDEYITETCFDFGKVDIGFKESTSPTMQCKSLDTLKEGETFTNKTKTVGVYYGITAESNSKWTTIVHIPEENHEGILPKTGK